jgi:hypothetical protein
MQIHAPTEIPASGRRTAFSLRSGATLGALAAALLLIAACESDGFKDAACSSAATIDGWFGEETSQGRAEDCGGRGGQAAQRTSGTPSAATGGKQASQAQIQNERHLTDRATVRDLQLRLTKLGYDPGPADGQMGPKTRAAIRAYQKNSGLRADGQVTASLMQRLRTES